MHIKKHNDVWKKFSYDHVAVVINNDGVFTAIQG